MQEPTWLSEFWSYSWECNTRAMGTASDESRLGTGPHKTQWAEHSLSQWLARGVAQAALCQCRSQEDALLLVLTTLRVSQSSKSDVLCACLSTNMELPQQTLLKETLLLNTVLTLFYHVRYPCKISEKNKSSESFYSFLKQTASHQASMQSPLVCLVSWASINNGSRG